MKTFTKTIAIGLLALTLGTIAIAQSHRNRSVDPATAVSRISALSRSIVENAARGRDVRTAAKQRFELMRSLAESDPARLLDAATQTDLRGKLPADVHEYLESRETAEGVFEMIAECEEHKGKIEYFLKRGEEELHLYLDGEPDQSVVSGKAVSVRGVKVGDAFVATADALTAESSDSFTSQASALTGTTGEKRVLVILVNFQDKQTQPFTVEHARNMTFNTTSSYYYENSYGQTWLTGDVYGWYTIPVSSTVCDTAAIALNAEQAAAAAGVNVSAYSHKIYGFPKTSACGFAGRGSVGGSPSQAWINSDRYGLEVVGHEFGHNLGLQHSRSLDCGTEVVGSNCSWNEYGDAFDLMGAAIPAHVNLFQKERLGWLNTGIQTVESSGTYRIEPYSTSGAAPKGLKLLKSTDPSTGRRTWYYLEHRSPSGFDSSLTNYNVQNGVVVHTGTESSAFEIYLLDMTPATAEMTDGYLAAGRSFTDPVSGATITTISADSTGAWVNIDIPAQQCSRANPSVSITPGQSPWMSKGSSFTYSVSVTNNNSGGCSTENFSLGTSIPSGLTGSLSALSLSLGNGATGTATLYVTSSSSTADGTYNVAVSAANTANSAYTRSASASYVLVSSLAVTATPGSTKYTRSQTASVTAYVSAAGAPLAGVAVTFTMTKPSGATVNQTGYTGSDGRAVFSYKFNRKSDPTGTYTVKAVAGANGYSGQAATSFSVTK